MVKTLNQNSQKDHKPLFHLQRIYLKDLSLEMPNVPGIFFDKNYDPDIKINVNVNSQNFYEDCFESRITITITSQIRDKVVYLIEATQAGIFDFTEIPKEQIETLLGITCPTILYPYLRANISDLINRTSLPSFHLTDINFQFLYNKKLNKNQKIESE
ncbi:MAG: protein-export chaperone SecB [Bordetella sp.]|nr:MAG: protein-export chaperone SecB [Bordetella sp.]